MVRFCAVSSLIQHIIHQSSALLNTQLQTVCMYETIQAPRAHFMHEHMPFAYI